MFIYTDKYKNAISCNCMKKHIKYGKFERTEWNSICGLEDPLVQKWFECIDFMDWSEYELWVHGSILEDRPTLDIDLTLIGPDSPERVNFMLETMVACGFHLGIYADVKYLYDGELFDHQEWLENPHWITNIYANYRPEIEVDGKNFNYGESISGYYISTQVHPLKKVRHKNMPSPVRIL